MARVAVLSGARFSLRRGCSNSIACRATSGNHGPSLFGPRLLNSSTPGASCSSPSRCCSRSRAISPTSATAVAATPSAKGFAMTSRALSSVNVRGQSLPLDGKSCSGRKMSSDWPSAFWSRRVPTTLSPPFRSSTLQGSFAGGDERSRFWLSTSSSCRIPIECPEPACDVELPPLRNRAFSAAMRDSRHPQYPGGGANPQYPSSINPAMCRHVRSSYCRPMIWMPTGRPFASPMGATVEGR